MLSSHSSKPDDDDDKSVSRLSVSDSVVQYDNVEFCFYFNMTLLLQDVETANSTAMRLTNSPRAPRPKGNIFLSNESLQQVDRSNYAKDR